MKKNLIFRGVVLTALFFLNVFFLKARIGYLNLAIVGAFHPEMALYNIAQGRFYRDFKVKNLKEYQKERNRREQEVMKNLEKMKKENERLMAQIKTINRKIEELDRNRYQNMVQAKIDYENQLKGITPNQFVKFEYKLDDKTNKVKTKVELPQEPLKPEDISPELKASYFREYRKRIKLIDKSYYKNLAYFQKKMKELKEKLEKNYEKAYLPLLLSKKESEKKFKEIFQEIKKAVAIVAKKKRLSAVFNNSVDFLKYYQREEEKTKNKSPFDISQEAMNIEKKYKELLEKFTETHPFSPRNRLRKMKKGDLKKVDLDNESLYLEYQSWFNELDYWFKNNIKNYKSLDFNSNFFLTGGEDITLPVLRIIFAHYNISPLQQQDIFDYIKKINKNF